MTMENSNEYSLSRELKMLESERNLSKLAIKGERDKYARMLNGAMGKDLEDVINGRSEVRLSLKEKLGYKIRFFFDFIFKLF